MERKTLLCPAPRVTESALKPSPLRGESTWVQTEHPVGGPAFNFDRIAVHSQRGAGDTPGILQAKLTLGAPGDAYEQEADQAADGFIHLSQRPALATPFSSHVQRKCTRCEAGQEAPSGLEARVQEATRTGGQPLPPTVRAQAERYFAHDFSRVRLHGDDGAARALNAQAFTVGPDIVFRAGQYQPDTLQGQHLLAHELTHVVQQQAARPLSPTGASPLSAPRQLQRQVAEETPAAVAPPAPAAPPAQARTCALTTYTGSNFTGDTVVADIDFIGALNSISAHAVNNGVSIYVTNSFREVGATLTGTIVPPATRSNHLTGHAIDMNPQAEGRLYNSKQLKKSNLANLPQSVQGFIRDIRNDAGLRWGGDFSAEDPVHIDDGLNGSAAAWNARYAATQQARKDKCGQ